MQSLTNEGNNRTWMRLDEQNYKFLMEDLEVTQEKVESDTEYYYNRLPFSLRVWAEEQIDDQTEILLSVQAAFTDMDDLDKIVMREVFNNVPENRELVLRSEHIGWLWHLLYMEV